MIADCLESYSLVIIIVRSPCFKNNVDILAYAGLRVNGVIAKMFVYACTKSKTMTLICEFVFYDVCISLAPSTYSCLSTNPKLTI